jgi:hypothetical protein
VRSNHEKLTRSIIAAITPQSAPCEAKTMTTECLSLQSKGCVHDSWQCLGALYAWKCPPNRSVQEQGVENLCIMLTTTMTILCTHYVLNGSPFEAKSHALHLRL